MDDVEFDVVLVVEFRDCRDRCFEDCHRCDELARAEEAFFAAFLPLVIEDKIQPAVCQASKLWFFRLYSHRHECLP